ncbi:MAG: hypothetical protein JWN98_353 [Abditibacteriota bacterium]|nr:hypothetical protein [Abditibacteriota bacterium]
MTTEKIGQTRFQARETQSANAGRQQSTPTDTFQSTAHSSFLPRLKR